MRLLNNLVGSSLILLQSIDATPLKRDYSQTRDTVSRFTVKDTKAFAAATPLEQTQNVLSLKSTGVKAKGSRALHDSLRASFDTSLIAAEAGQGYGIDIVFGGTTFEVIFDTGSSDLWLAETDVDCVNAYFESQPASACGFGPLAPSTFSDGALDGYNFNISYGDGEFLTGKLGYENVCIAGICLMGQEVAHVDYAYWNGDNVTSGLAGFAYPALTSMYSGTDLAADDPDTNAVQYNNWIFNAIDSGDIAPMFSIAIERGTNGGGGTLAIGGLPDIDFVHDFTSTPLQIVELSDTPAGASQYTYYTIVPDGFYTVGADGEVLSGGINESPSTDFPVIVDSGTTLIYLPTDLAEIVNSLFDPPSVYESSSGVYENDCDATPPTFAVRINGTDFFIDSADLLLTGKLGEDTSTGKCTTGVQAIDGVYILGDVFLRNVVAVFDIGASEMRFARHKTY